MANRYHSIDEIMESQLFYENYDTAEEGRVRLS